MAKMGKGLSDAYQAIKQAMANQGLENRMASLAQNNPYEAQHQPSLMRAWRGVYGDAGSMGERIKDFATIPMAIPALGGAAGTGALMAGGAGAGLGLAGIKAYEEYLKTKQLQEEAAQS